MSADSPASSPTPPPGPVTAPPRTVDRENPWPGLGTYDESMNAFFFGRDSEIEELLRLVRRDAVALFFGQSGLGKSSLLQAGLFPKLRAADMMPVHIRIRFGAEFPHPVEQILREIVIAAHAAGGEAPAPTPGISLFEYFYDERHEFWSVRNKVLTPVVVFDQFEEIFTLGSRDATSMQRRTELLVALADLAARRPPHDLVARFENDPELATRYGSDRTRCRLLFSMREDFLPELGSLREHLPTLASGGLRLQRLRGNAAQDVLEKPGGHLLEPGAAERIIRFVAADRSGAAAADLSTLDVEPALLNVVARELNNRRQRRKLERISPDLVQGARDEILGDFYERSLEGLDTRVREFIEEQLLTTTGYRDSVAVEDAEASFGVSREVLSRLVDRRLLRIDERFQMQRVELTHDLLTGVVKTSRDRRREREALEEARRRAEADRQAAQAAATAAQDKLKHTRVRVAVIGGFTLLAIGIGVLLPLWRKTNAALTETEKQRERANAANAELSTAMTAVTSANDRANKSLAEAKKGMSSYLFVQANDYLSDASFDDARLLLTLSDREKLLGESERNLFSTALEQSPYVWLEGVQKIESRPRHVELAPGGQLVVADAEGKLQIVSFAADAAGQRTTATAAAPGELGELTDIGTFDILWSEHPLIVVSTRAGVIGVHQLETGKRVAFLLEPAKASTAPATEGKQGAGDSLSQGGGAGAGISGNATAVPTVAAADMAGAGDESYSVRFSPDARGVATITAGGTVVVWRLNPNAAWEEDAPAANAPSRFTHYSTDKARLNFKGVTAPRAELSWAFDGSLMVADDAHGAWLRPPQKTWETLQPIERFEFSRMRFDTLPAMDYRESIWLMSQRTSSEIVWMRLPVNSSAGSNASRFKVSQKMADTVDSIAATPGSDLVFVALTNGNIAVCRLLPKSEKLRIVQTVAGPRSRHVELRVSPDGRSLAAAADDGRVFLYRVAAPTGEGNASMASVRLQRDADGDWMRVLDDGRFIKSRSAAPVEGLPFEEIKDASVLSVHIGSGADESIAFARSADEHDKEKFGVWSFTKKAWRWQIDAETLGVAPLSPGMLTGPPGFEAEGVIAPDGSLIAVASGYGNVVVISALDGKPARNSIRPGPSPVLVAWSGDSRRLAVVSEEQDIFVFDLAAPGDAKELAHLHAHNSKVLAIAMDQTGRALAYGTPDSHLVLEFFGGEERRSPLDVPLAASTAAIAFGPDGKSMAVVFDGRVHTLSARPAGDDTTSQEWFSQKQLVGYQLQEKQTHATELAHLDLQRWNNREPALLADGFVQRWLRWQTETIAGFRAQDPSTPPPEEIEATAKKALEIADSIDAHIAEFPTLAPLSEKLRAINGTPFALGDFFQSYLTSLQRWTLAFRTYGETDPATLDVDVADTIYKVFADRVGRDDALSKEERTFMTGIVRMLAADTDRNEQVWNKRAALVSKVVPVNVWQEIVLASPDDWLLAKESVEIFRMLDARADRSKVTEEERKVWMGIIRRLANNADRNEPIWNQRNLIVEKLLTLEQWDDIAFNSPDDWLVDKEAAALYSANNYAESTRFYLELERRDPKKLRYPIRRAQNYRFGGEPEKSLELLVKVEAAARELSDNSSLTECLASQAWTLKVLQRYDESYEKMDLAVLAMPESPWILREATSHFLDANLAARAEPYANRLVVVSTTPDDRILQARCVLDRDLTEGKALLEKIVADAADPRISVDAADRLRNFDFFSFKSTAADWLLDAYKQTTDHDLKNRALKSLGVAWREINRFPAARSAFDALIENTPTKNDMAFAEAEIGFILLLTRHPADAITWLEKSVKTSGSDDAWTSAQLGRANVMAGQTKKAIDHFKRAVELDGPSWTAEYVETLWRAGKLDDAASALDAGLKEHPTYRSWRLLKLRLTLAMGKPVTNSELTALDDGSRGEVSLRALALSGNAAAAAKRHLPNLNDAVSNDYLVASGLRALAFKQTGDDTERLAALENISSLLWVDFRGTKRLRLEFGMDALAADPLFVLAEQCMEAPFDSASSILDTARFEVRLAAICADEKDAATHRKRAVGTLEHGVKIEAINRKQILADAELAPVAPAPPDAH